MTSAREIRTQLQNWLDGAISFRQFEDWFVLETWNIHRSNDDEAESITDEIELNLSEYSDGLLTKEELAKELTRIAHVTMVTG